MALPWSTMRCNGLALYVRSISADPRHKTGSRRQVVLYRHATGELRCEDGRYRLRRHRLTLAIKRAGRRCSTGGSRCYTWSSWAKVCNMEKSYQSKRSLLCLSAELTKLRGARGSEIFRLAWVVQNPAGMSFAMSVAAHFGLELGKMLYQSSCKRYSIGMEHLLLSGIETAKLGMLTDNKPNCHIRRRAIAQW